MRPSPEASEIRVSNQHGEPDNPCLPMLCTLIETPTRLVTYCTSEETNLGTNFISIAIKEGTAGVYILIEWPLFRDKVQEEIK